MERVPVRTRNSEDVLKRKEARMRKDPLRPLRSYGNAATNASLQAELFELLNENRKRVTVQAGMASL